MKITIMTTDEQIISVDVDPDELVENVKALLEVETQIPLHQQQLLYHGKEIKNNQKLNGLGITEGDLLMLVSSSSKSGASTNELAMNADGSAVNPHALIRQLKGDPSAMSNLVQTNPDLAHAINGGDIESFQDLLRQQYRHRLELQRRQQEEIALMNADPFDIDAQKRIEEAIKQKNIDENWEAAIEHNPEAFARVIMLYVDMEVNGVPLKAFVDSGAQTTIISKSCAERCGLLRLLDKRYVGIAKGVGQTQIVGRIHVAPLKIGKNYYPCTFTVLDQPDLEFIFGLDMLRKHQCCIDLKGNVLRVGGGEIAVPFLQETDLPVHLQMERGNEHVVQEPPAAQSPSTSSARQPEADMEAKISGLVGLGFDRASVIQALKLFNGNADQAASYLFGG